MKTLAGIVFLFSVVLLGLVVFTNQLPDPVQPRECSCAGQDDCFTQVFQVDDGEKAFCAFWGEREGCCHVMRNSQ